MSVSRVFREEVRVLVGILFFYRVPTVDVSNGRKSYATGSYALNRATHSIQRHVDPRISKQHSYLLPHQACAATCSAAVSICATRSPAARRLRRRPSRHAARRMPATVRFPKTGTRLAARLGLVWVACRRARVRCRREQVEEACRRARVRCRRGAPRK